MRLRFLTTLALLLAFLLTSFLYAFSWTLPHCLVAWKDSTSFMLATSDGKLWLLHEADDSPEAPAPSSWVIRTFSGVLRGSDGDAMPSPFDGKRARLSTAIPDDAGHGYAFAGFSYLAGGGGPGGFSPAPPAFHVVTVPLWLIWIPLAVVTFLITRRTVTLFQRRRHGLCLCCGFDLRASNERCPECGTPIPAKIAPANLPPALRNFWNRLLDYRAAAIVCLLVLFVATEWFRNRPSVRYLSTPVVPATQPAEYAKLVHLTFAKTPLKEVLDTLSKESGIGILTHWKEMGNTGFAEDTQVTAQMNTPLPLGDALRYILHEISPDGLRFTLDEQGIVHVGTRDEMERLYE